MFGVGIECSVPTQWDKWGGIRFCVTSMFSIVYCKHTLAHSFHQQHTSCGCWHPIVSYWCHMSTQTWNVWHLAIKCMFTCAFVFAGFLRIACFLLVSRTISGRWARRVRVVPAPRSTMIASAAGLLLRWSTWTIPTCWSCGMWCSWSLTSEAVQFPCDLLGKLLENVHKQCMPCSLLSSFLERSERLTEWRTYTQGMGHTRCTCVSAYSTYYMLDCQCHQITVFFPTGGFALKVIICSPVFQPVVAYLLSMWVVMMVVYGYCTFTF